MLDEFKKWVWFAFETAFIVPLAFWRAFWAEWALHDTARRIRETRRLDVPTWDLPAVPGWTVASADPEHLWD